MIHSLRAQGHLNVPAGSYVHTSVHILGKNNIQIGVNTCVSEGGWLNVNSRQKDKISITIGDNCYIGKQNFFTSGELITIGDYTLTTIGCKFIGSSHIIDNPEIPYLLTGTTLTNKIIIGVNCFIGADATVLGNIRVGHGSVVGANSLVLRDVPPFSLVVGNPAKIQKRYSFAKKSWLPVSEITEEDERAMPNEQDYLAQLKTQYPHINMPWIAAGKSMGDL